MKEISCIDKSGYKYWQGKWRALKKTADTKTHQDKIKLKINPKHNQRRKN